MIQWALNLKMLSSAAYHATRTSGFMHLSSDRTLRNYVPFYQAKPGFQKERNDHLIAKAECRPSRRRNESSRRHRFRQELWKSRRSCAFGRLQRFAGEIGEKRQRRKAVYSHSHVLGFIERGLVTAEIPLRLFANVR